MGFPALFEEPGRKNKYNNKIKPVELFNLHSDNNLKEEFRHHAGFIENVMPKCFYPIFFEKVTLK